MEKGELRALKKRLKECEKKAKLLKQNFVKNPNNLEYLARFAFDEFNDAGYLLSGARNNEPYQNAGESLIGTLKNYNRLERMLYSSLPAYMVRTKEEYAGILSNAKPFFNELTGISLLKEPEIKVMESKPMVAYELVKPVIGAAFVLGAIVSGFSLAAGAGIALSAAAGAIPAAAFSAAAFAASYLRLRNTAGFAIPPDISDKIYVSPEWSASAVSIVFHEYTHNMRFKSGFSTDVSFLEEGIATAAAAKIMKMHEITQHTELAAYASMERYRRSLKSFAMLCRCFGQDLQLWAYHPFALDMNESKEKMEKSSNFNYFCGASMVEIAEFKHGNRIYSDLFEGKYDCLLD
ncbi:MAG: hypothetical protein PHO02_03190 [Candidatus Nanoarchaeia archaeon]|nr:hypothetical protein [Candidatus Nanoarchaeia archaeon]